MRFPFLGLAVAASAVLSTPLWAQNSVQPHFFGSHTFTPADGPPEATTVEFGVPPTPGTAANVATAIAANTSVANTSVHIDWREKGAVTAVEDTGQCNSDWAFSAKGAVEGEQAIHKGILPVLSAQQLVDCGGSSGSRGCYGGLPEEGLLYLKLHGAVAASAYRYTARDGSCKQAQVVAKFNGIKRSPIGDDAALLAMLEKDGPVSVIVDDNWISEYRGDNQSCASRASSYISALLVGAITRAGEPVWVLKFPLGTTFGDKGYAYLSRLRPNECGITDYAIVPLP